MDTRPVAAFARKVMSVPAIVRGLNKSREFNMNKIRYIGSDEPFTYPEEFMSDKRNLNDLVFNIAAKTFLTELTNDETSKMAGRYSKSYFDSVAKAFTAEQEMLNLVHSADFIRYRSITICTVEYINAFVLTGRVDPFTFNKIINSPYYQNIPPHLKRDFIRQFGAVPAKAVIRAFFFNSDNKYYKTTFKNLGASPDEHELAASMAVHGLMNYLNARPTYKIGDDGGLALNWVSEPGLADFMNNLNILPYELP